MGNGVSSIIFSCRSGDKAVHGDVGRAVTCAAQGVNAAQAYAQTGFAGSKVAGGAVKYIDEVAKTDTIWGKGAKGLQWAQSHVNPIIGVSAGLKIAFSDDKEKAFCTEVPGFMGMLVSEGYFKKMQKTSAFQNAMKSIVSKCGKHGKVVGAVVEGLGFAAASIGGYKVASTIGEYAIEGERAMKARKQLNCMA